MKRDYDYNKATGHYSWQTNDDGLMCFSSKRAAVRAAERAVTPPEGRRGLFIDVYSPTGLLVAVVRGEDALLPESLRRDMQED